MSKIKILPDTLISQIAAGEVIDRPASAVKELLENSLDAGASFCSIEIEQGGAQLIAVRDNGCGMDASDAVAAFARHATSKIAQFSDLEKIESYGFRGEALAAIASVSLVCLKTRRDKDDAGTEVVFSAGKLQSQNSAGCPPGTEIVVRNLFFSTPARKKFLKSPNTEFAHIVAISSHLALANPAVGFELKHNGKTIFHCALGQTPEARLCEILGGDFLSRSIPVSFATPSIHIHGFIGEPGMPRSSKRHQYLFINGRDVSDPLVARAITDAYGSRLPPRTWPAFVVNVDMDPREVDINVHPRKLTVKFLDSGRIYKDIFQAASQALEKFEKKIFASASTAQNAQNDGTQYDAQNLSQAALKFPQPEQEKRPDGLVAEPFSELQIIAQVADSYILIRTEEGLAIVDQHAAHERILYEKFRSAATESRPQTQPLLVPLALDCSREEAIFLQDAVRHLQAFGFEFDQWSGNTFVIRGCPLAMKTENLSKIFRDFLNDMMSEKINKEILPERILKSLACKTAVKFGMKLSLPEQQKLMRDLGNTPNGATCPHGRPTKVIVTFEELERRFYRRK